MAEAATISKPADLNYIYIIIAIIAIIILFLWHLEEKRLMNQPLNQPPAPDMTDLNNNTAGPVANISAGNTNTGYAGPLNFGTQSFDPSNTVKLTDEPGNQNNFYAQSSIGNQLYN